MSDAQTYLSINVHINIMCFYVMVSSRGFVDRHVPVILIREARVNRWIWIQNTRTAQRQSWQPWLYIPHSSIWSLLCNIVLYSLVLSRLASSYLSYSSSHNMQEDTISRHAFIKWTILLYRPVHFAFLKWHFLVWIFYFFCFRPHNIENRIHRHQFLSEI